MSKQHVERQHSTCRSNVRHFASTCCCCSRGLNCASRNYFKTLCRDLRVIHQWTTYGLVCCDLGLSLFLHKTVLIISPFVVLQTGRQWGIWRKRGNRSHNCPRREGHCLRGLWPHGCHGRYNPIRWPDKFDDPRVSGFRYATRLALSIVLCVL